MFEPFSRTSLAELAARFRGIDQWPVARATVTESELFSAPRSGEWNHLSFYYRSADSELQSGTISVDSLTGMYALKNGDEFSLQYDPKHPSSFYCSEAQSFTRTFQAIMLPLVVGFVLVIVAIAALHSLQVWR